MHVAELQIALRNTLIVGGGVVVLAVPVAAVLAIFLLRTNAYGARWCWLAMCSQLVVPLYVFAGGWSAGFGTMGWWPIAPAKTVSAEWTSLLAVLLIHAAAVLPWLCLILAMGLVWTQSSLEEMAVVEGGWPQVLRQVTLPSLRPWLMLAGLWALVPVLTEMAVTNLYQVPTLPEQVYLDVSLSGTSSWTYFAAVGLCILPLSIGALGINQWLPPWKEFVRRAAHARQPNYPLGAWRLFVSAAIWSVVLALVAVPAGNLVYKAGWQTIAQDGAPLAHHWSFSRFGLTLWETATLFGEEAYWTALLAVCSASCAMIAGASMRIGGRTPVVRGAMALACLVLLATPGPLATQTVTLVFNWLAWCGAGWLYDSTLAAPVLAQQFRLLPLAYLLCVTLLSSIDERTWELAAQDGFGWKETLFFVIVPQTGARWLAAWYMLAAFSIGELSTNLLVLPPGVTTVAQRLFEFLHFGMRYQDSGLCLALLAVGWLAAAILWKTRRAFQ